MKRKEQGFAGQFWCACALSAGLGVLPVGAAERVGQFLVVTEGVRVQRGERELKAFLLSPLEAGDEVRVPRDGQAEVVLDARFRRLFLLGGSVCRVQADRIVTLNGRRAPQEKRRLSATRRLPGYATRTLGRLAKGDDLAFVTPPQPVGGVRNYPTSLSWSGIREGQLPASGEIQVEIREGEGPASAVGQVIFSRQLPADQRAVELFPGVLRRGVRYSWSLRIIRQGSPGSPVLLLPVRILTEEETEALKEVEKWPRKSAADWLAAAVAYERADLRAEALQALQKAYELQPDPELQKAIDQAERALLNLPPLPAGSAAASP